MATGSSSSVSIATRVACVVLASLLLCCEVVKGQGPYQGYTGPCSSSQVGIVQQVYQNSGPVPRPGVKGSLCSEKVVPFDQEFVSTCTALCCTDAASCTCGATKSAFVSCSASAPIAATIYCWVATSPIIVDSHSTCCANFTMNPSTLICEATPAPTSTTPEPTTAVPKTTPPKILLMLTEGPSPANNNSAPAPLADTGLQGPLLYGVIGAIVFLALAILLLALIFFCCRRRRREVDDFSSLEARVKVAPAGKKADKFKGKDAKVTGDKGGEKVKGEQVPDDRKGSTSSTRELFYDIDDLSGEVFAVEGPLPVTEDDLALTFAPASPTAHNQVSRAVSNDYTTLPHAAQVQVHSNPSQGQGQTRDQISNPDPIYQTIP